ncbi:MAG: CTP synthase, partial [Methanosarcinales archaeon]
KKKISLFCDVPVKAVISASNIDNLYKIPLVLEDDGIIDYLMKRLSLNKAHKHSFLWRDMVASIDNFESSVKVAIVGKYTQLSDSYLSIYEALRHAGIANKCNVDIELFDAESITLKDLKETDGIIVPGGFGVRGTEGKMNAIKFARENNIPFLGLCLGMQLAVIEFARNVLGLEGANSTELSNCKHPVIDLLPEQNGISDLGGTMRLGDYKTIIKKDTLAYRIYGKTEIVERHRHRYEVNPSYVEQIERAGMRFSGRDGKGIRMEIAEIPTHRFFIGTQFHPEFKSRPLHPHPIFKKFIEEII